MDNQKVKIKVVFRKFPEGDIIALFPEEIADFKGNILSYQRIGQHGGASPELLNELNPASLDEYLPLKKELESIGYILESINFELKINP